MVWAVVANCTAIEPPLITGSIIGSLQVRRLHSTQCSQPRHDVIEAIEVRGDLWVSAQLGDHLRVVVEVQFSDTVTLVFVHT